VEVDMNSMTQTKKRDEYVAGLRALADAIDADPDLPLPYHGGSTEAIVFCDDKAEMVAWARLMTGAKRKEIDENSAYGFELHGQVLGLRVGVYVRRDEVCRRVVKGVRTETKTEDVTEVVGTREVTVEVEDVEWVCEPLLAAAVSS
jgi:hypothetical protein